MDLIARQPVVLLADADAMVGMDVGDALERSGYRVLGPFVTTAEALVALKQDSPTLVVLDVMLRDGPCTELVTELRRRGTPFLVHSRLYLDAPLPLGFQPAPWLSKPALPDDVVALLDEMAFLSAAPISTELTSPLRLVRQGEGTANPLVRKLEGFSALSEADRAMLERISAEMRTVAPHTDLVREGDKPDGVFLVMQGIACRHKHRANGARQILAYLLPGDLCDLDVALLNTMDHTITTLSACRVVRIAPETVAGIMEHHPSVARALRMSTLVDEATLREWLVNVGRRTATERVAHLFCELLVRLQAVGLASENSYALPLTQTDLADTTGLSAVHVNRSLQELRRKGLIELKSRQLTILNPLGLKAVGEFKANYLHLGDRIAA